MINKIYQFLGLAKKANKIVSGEEGCEKAVKQKKVQLVIVAQDASENTKKKFLNSCNYYNINIRTFGEKELIGRYVGKDIRAIVGITDKGFALKLMEMIDSE